MFPVSKGRFVSYADLAVGASPTILVILIKSTVQADATLQTYLTLSTLLAGSGNTEANFTNYVRKVISSPLTVTTNTGTGTGSNSVAWAGATWLAAGGATNNSMGKLIFAYRPTSSTPDSGCIPLAKHDLTSTTTGSDYLVTVAGNVLGTAT